mmetsp:Transcript_146541/g.470108  ORF Transcript_146541/g.470108 Transcript_146541/m.470108 type:complete len:208 (-) Transcript_146541:1033-1656(-)
MSQLLFEPGEEWPEEGRSSLCLVSNRAYDAVWPFRASEAENLHPVLEAELLDSKTSDGPEGEVRSVGEALARRLQQQFRRDELRGGGGQGIARPQEAVRWSGQAAALQRHTSSSVKRGNDAATHSAPKSIGCLLTNEGESGRADGLFMHFERTRKGGWQGVANGAIRRTSLVDVTSAGHELEGRVHSEAEADAPHRGTAKQGLQWRF